MEGGMTTWRIGGIIAISFFLHCDYARASEVTHKVRALFSTAPISFNIRREGEGMGAAELGTFRGLGECRLSKCRTAKAHDRCMRAVRCWRASQVVGQQGWTVQQSAGNVQLLLSSFLQTAWHGKATTEMGRAW